jgi:hypothetical protein
MSEGNVELVKAVYSVVNAPDLVAAFRDEDFLREMESAVEPLRDGKVLKVEAYQDRAKGLAAVGLSE